MTFGVSTELGSNRIFNDDRAAVSSRGVFVSKNQRATHPAVNATITVGAETANVRTIGIQLLDSLGNNIDERTKFELIVYSGVTGSALATGGSTGIGFPGSAGIDIATIRAKLYFAVQTNSAGLLNVTWTDTGTESVAIGAVLPNGNIIISEAFANT